MGCASGREPSVCRSPGKSREVDCSRAMAHTPLKPTARVRFRAQPRRRVRSRGEDEDDEAGAARNSQERSLAAPPASIAGG